jgi:hypothetical protein
MAESETRLETLEDEVRVLKGEVKRTLVDLRALLMNEDSPLSPKVLTRRAPNGVAEASDKTVAGPAQEEGLEETAPGIDGMSPADLLSGPGFNLPLDDPPSGPPQTRSSPIPGLFAGDSTSNQDDQPESESAGQMPDQIDARLPEVVKGSEGPSNHHAGREAEVPLPAEKAAASHGSLNLNGRGHLTQDEEEQPLETPAQHSRVNSVYDEYRELLEETRQTHSIEDEPVGPPLDINLLSNLVHWVALAKKRVGEEQLKDILQLYIQSGHSRPELQDLLLQVSRMVDVDPPGVREAPREWVDLMFHLHGILTGGFPVIKIPPIRLSTHEETRDGQG